MNKNYLLLAVSVLLVLRVFAQNIGINADGSRPNANAILDIKSGNKGLLIPRMDSVARNAIPNTKGLLVYDISTDNFWYNTGEKWECIPNDKDRKKGSGAWLLKGNGNTKDGVDFLGTTDNVPLNIRMNNRPSGLIDSFTGRTYWGFLAGSHDAQFANTGIGAYALSSNTFGATNTAIGYQSLYSNITGNNNTASGYQSLFSNTSGSFDVAIGHKALYANTTGNANTATGYFSLNANTTGTDNTANGWQSMQDNITGNRNTASGFVSLISNNSGSGNTAIGYEALPFNLTGNDNTAIGDSSLISNNNGNNNTAIGQFADVSKDGLNNATAIGSGAVVDASNKVRIGNGAVTVIEGQVPFTTPSDGRYKFNVRENVKGLEFILQLRPVTYQFDVMRFDALLKHQPHNPNNPGEYAINTAYDEAARIRRSGFIAQEVEHAAMASGYDFSGIIRPKTDQDHYSLSYDAFVVPLVKAVQEQQQIILQQNKKLEEQEKKLGSLQTQLDELKKLLQPGTRQ
jgi:hypothetical protein